MIWLKGGKRLRYFKSLLVKVKFNTMSVLKISSFFATKLASTSASSKLRRQRLLRSLSTRKKCFASEMLFRKKDFKSRLSQKNSRIHSTIIDGVNSRELTLILLSCSSRFRHSKSDSLRKLRK